MTPLTLSELRLRHAQLDHRAERLRQEWRTVTATSPKAGALGRAVKAARAQADDYARLLKAAEGEA
jgi:hypothetical protein